MTFRFPRLHIWFVWNQAIPRDHVHPFLLNSEWAAVRFHGFTIGQAFVGIIRRVKADTKVEKDAV